jgi:hypothetical protein
LQPCSQERGKRTITAKITYNGHYMLDVLWECVIELWRVSTEVLIHLDNSNNLN